MAPKAKKKVQKAAAKQKQVEKKAVKTLKRQSTLEQKKESLSKKLNTPAPKKTAKSNSKQQKKSKKAPSPEPEEKPQKKVKKNEAKKEEKEEEKKIVKAIKKGSAVVDIHCPLKDEVHVYETASKVYDASLNQANLDRNNNKFYIIQLLQHDKNPNQFYNWTRWGRVGVIGQNALVPNSNVNAAIQNYEKKLRDKTISGEYVQLEIVTGDDEKKEEEKKSKKKGKKEAVKSKLDPRLQNLINLIFDMKMINNQIKEIGYDAKKMHLGKLGNSTILKGYDVLNELLDAIRANQGQATYSKLSSQFYTLIPHDFGFQKMANFIITTESQVREKFDMLQSLTDMKIAQKLIDEGCDENLDEIEQNYKKLKCEVKPLDQKSKEWKMIDQYVTNTKGHWKIKLLDAYKLERDGDLKKYNKKMPNKFLLWHGSRIGNYVGILSQGLRITPGAGGLFGRGLYFADMLEKSAGYCSTENNIALAVLTEVAMGNINEKMTFDHNAHNLPKGKDSVRGCATQAPDPSKYQMWNDVQVPNSQVTKFKGNIGHNEYLIYKDNQAVLQFLVKFERTW